MKVEKYEIDMLGVDAADALFIRFFDDSGNYYVILVDSGRYSDGEKIYNFLTKRYNTHTIDLAICTHCDEDHFGGFIYLLQQKLYAKQEYLKIQKMLINIPENNHSVYTTQEGNLIDLLTSVHIPYESAFSDKHALEFEGIIEIIGPTQNFYNTLVPKFKSKTLCNETLQERNNLYSDTLGTSADSSPHNRSSIIFLFKPSDGKKFLFTGDADLKAFENVDSSKIQNVYWLKLPHHGSGCNISEQLINHLHPEVAYVSASKGYGQETEEKKILNLLKAIKTNVYSTNGNTNVWHYCGTVPDREDYSQATPL